MGLAASQVRLLSLTSRKADVEMKMQLDSKRKTMLTREATVLSKLYYAKLQASRYQYSTENGYNDVTYNYLMGSNGTSYIPSLQEIARGDARRNVPELVVTNSQGQIILDNTLLHTVLNTHNNYTNKNWTKSSIEEAIYATSLLCKQADNDFLSGKDFQSFAETLAGIYKDGGTSAIEKLFNAVTINADNRSTGLNKSMNSMPGKGQYYYYNNNICKVTNDANKQWFVLDNNLLASLDTQGINGYTGTAGTTGAYIKVNKNLLDGTTGYGLSENPNDYKGGHLTLKEYLFGCDEPTYTYAQPNTSPLEQIMKITGDGQYFLGNDNNVHATYSGDKPETLPPNVTSWEKTEDVMKNYSYQYRCDVKGKPLYDIQNMLSNSLWAGDRYDQATNLIGMTGDVTCFTYSVISDKENAKESASKYTLSCVKLDEKTGAPQDVAVTVVENISKNDMNAFKNMWKYYGDVLKCVFEPGAVDTNGKMLQNLNVAAILVQNADGTITHGEKPEDEYKINTSYEAINNDVDGENEVFLAGIKSGIYMLKTTKRDDYNGLDYFINRGYFVEKADSDQRERITAWYNAEKAELDEKETYWDSEISSLSTELETITSEMESIKSLRDNAIQTTFKWGG